MRSLFSFLLILVIITACNNKKEPETTTTTKDTAIVKPPKATSAQKVTYKSATYYTGRVDFYFVDDNGDEVTVGISNFPEDSAAVYPKELLESGEDLEGPPGENPAMVGKQFLLVRDSTGKLLEIKAAN